MSLWESGEKRVDKLEVYSNTTTILTSAVFHRFLCGTCNISFKLDRRKGLKVDGGKKSELASRAISSPAKKGL